MLIMTSSPAHRFPLCKMAITTIFPKQKARAQEDREKRLMEMEKASILLYVESSGQWAVMGKGYGFPAGFDMSAPGPSSKHPTNPHGPGGREPSSSSNFSDVTEAERRPSLKISSWRGRPEWNSTLGGEHQKFQRSISYRLSVSCRRKS